MVELVRRKNGGGDDGSEDLLSIKEKKPKADDPEVSTWQQICQLKIAKFKNETDAIELMTALTEKYCYDKIKVDKLYAERNTMIETYGG